MDIRTAPAGELKSAKYLILADERADSGALLEALRQVTGRDDEASFTLLVPARPAANSLTWTEGENIASARRRANEARRRLERAGIRIAEALIGDASPVQAIADILASRGPFYGIIISTEPPWISRWLKLDVQTIARKRFPVPVISGREARAAA